MKFTFEHYETKALEIFLKYKKIGSFPTKVSKKECLDNLSRAYDCLLDNKTYPDCDDIDYNIWDIPHNLHQIRDKHKVILPYFGIDADKVMALSYFRQDVQAIDVVKPVKVKQENVFTANQATHLGTCQICGAMQKVSKTDGAIASHGYTLQHGFFEGDCYGSRCYPYETHTDRLSYYIVALNQLKDETNEYILSGTYPDHLNENKCKNIIASLVYQIINAEKRISNHVVKELTPIEIWK